MDGRSFHRAKWEWTERCSLVNLLVILVFSGVWRPERSSGDHHCQLERFESLLWRSLYNCLHFQRFVLFQFDCTNIKFHHWQHHVHSLRTYQYFDYRQFGLSDTSDAASLVIRFEKYHCSRITWNEPIRLFQPECAHDLQRGCDQL